MRLFSTAAVGHVSRHTSERLLSGAASDGANDAGGAAAASCRHALLPRRAQVPQGWAVKSWSNVLPTTESMYAYAKKLSVRDIRKELHR